MDDLAPNALHVPVHLFHGDQDPVVPVAVSRQWHRRLLEIGAPAEYVEFPGARHNSWDPAYKDASIFDWFSKFRRVRNPERVRFVSGSYRYNSAYWIRFDALTPGTLASIDAKFAGKDRLEIVTSNLDGFTLELNGHPLYSQRLRIVIDGAPVKQTRLPSSSFHRSDGGWQTGKQQSRAKRPGLEGPMREVVASRHIYVYGTADSPHPEELARRRDVADRAAEWRGATRLTLDLQVRADRDVREQDLAECNLVLFGTAETNRLIARMAGDLPMALNAGAADYGLVYAYPAGQRYVLINSGLPLLTGVERLRGQYRFMPPLLAMLLPRGDYMLFKGSLENVLDEGRFDNEWKVPPDAATRLSATGAVMLKSLK
jgi:hypothetical protein